MQACSANRRLQCNHRYAGDPVPLTANSCFFVSLTDYSYPYLLSSTQIFTLGPPTPSFRPSQHWIADRTTTTKWSLRSETPIHSIQRSCGWLCSQRMTEWESIIKTIGRFSALLSRTNYECLWHNWRLNSFFRSFVRSFSRRLLLVFNCYRVFDFSPISCVDPGRNRLSFVQIIQA